MKQTIRMMDLKVSGHSFWAEPSFIDWKVVARFHSHHVLVLDEEVHSTLNSAIRAVSGHHAIDHTIRAPAIVRGVVEMGPILVDNLIQKFDFTHDVRDP